MTLRMLSKAKAGKARPGVLTIWGVEFERLTAWSLYAEGGDWRATFSRKRGGRVWSWRLTLRGRLPFLRIEDPFSGCESPEAARDALLDAVRRLGLKPPRSGRKGRK